MDPLSITASVIAIIQITQTCLKLGDKHLRSHQTPAHLTALIQELYCFNGTIKSLQTFLEIHEDDEARLSTMSCLDGPLSNCEHTLLLLRERLANTSFLGFYLGKRITDKMLEESMDVLERGQALVKIVLLTDQRNIISAVERYTINIAEDVRDLHTDIDSNNQLMQHLATQVENDRKQAGEQHTAMTSALNQLGENLSQLRDDVARWNRQAEKQQTMGWVSATIPSLDLYTNEIESQPEQASPSGQPEAFGLKSIVFSVLASCFSRETQQRAQRPAKSTLMSKDIQDVSDLQGKSNSAPQPSVTRYRYSPITGTGRVFLDRLSNIPTRIGFGKKPISWKRRLR